MKTVSNFIFLGSIITVDGNCSHEIKRRLLLGRKVMTNLDSIAYHMKEIGIPDHLTCLLRNLYAGQEATVRTGHGKADWFQIGKRVCQGFILAPCLFNLHVEYII